MEIELHNEKAEVTHLVRHTPDFGVEESVAITRGEESVVFSVSELKFVALKLQEILALQDR